MLEGLGEKTPGEGLGYNGLFGNGEIAVMQEVAPKFGVTIRILAKEGNVFTYQDTNEETGNIETHRSTVRNGLSYINYSGPQGNLGDFWNAVHAEEKAKQLPTNPPKI